MTDILHRLHCTIRCDIETAASGCHCAAARDEITRLRAENERLRAEVQRIKGDPGYAKYQRAREEIDRLRAAIAWIDAPFVDDSTPEAELRQRVKFCVADASRAALAAQPIGEKHE